MCQKQGQGGGGGCRAGPAALLTRIAANLSRAIGNDVLEGYRVLRLLIDLDVRSFGSVQEPTSRGRRRGLDLFQTRATVKVCEWRES